MRARCLLVGVVTLFILGTLAGPVHAKIDPETVVGIWLFDEGAGGVAGDASGNGNDGTLNGPQWTTQSKFGGALEFDGAGSYIEFATGESMKTPHLTVLAWFNTRRLSGQGVIFQTGNDWNDMAGYVFRVNNNGAANSGVAFASGNTATWLNGPALEADTWYHMALTYDGTTATLYLDGENVSSNPGAGQGEVMYDDQPVRIGVHSDSTGGAFDGFIDEVALFDVALATGDIQAIMGSGLAQITAGSDEASDPLPADGQTDVWRDGVLNWTPGAFADTHNVYFGTAIDDVTNASASDPRGVLAGPGLTDASFDPGRLSLDQTYYWRVDEVNRAPDNTVFKGDVWSFTTELLAYPIENLTATASSGDLSKGPENTVNGSGLDDSGLLHSNIGVGQMWLSSPTGDQPTWIVYEFDKVHKLHELWVWNSNESVESMIGFGARDVTIEYSVDGTAYTTLGATHEFARAPGTADYAHNTTVDFEGVAARYVRLTIHNNWGGILNQFGLSEVRFFSVPVSAREPSPQPGATDVAIADTVLSWRAGREAAGHDVYLSADEQAVIDGDAPAATVTEPGYASSFDLGSTYYWRIDEVNDAESATTWQGDVWNFSTQEFLVVDDFESYNDIEPGQEDSNPVYETWADGYDNPSVNGSTIGYFEAFQPTMESSIVYSGGQSVPLFYDNTVASYSEVSANTDALAVGPDWTKGSPSAMTLWFYGDPNNAATDQMYVTISGVKVVYDDDIVNLTKQRWTQWNIDLTSLGVSLGNVTSLSIGFERTGAFGGAGIVLIDDIRLYGTPPPLLAAGDPGSNGLVVYLKLDEGSGATSADSSGNGHNATINPPNTDLVKWTADGYTGAALEFTTTLSEPYTVVDAPLTPGMLNIAQATYAFWMKMPSAHQNWGIVFELVGEQTDFSLEPDPDGVLYHKTPWFGSGQARVNDNQWHHVALTFSDAEDYTIIYVDGAEVARSSSSGSEPITAVRIGGPRVLSQIWASFTGTLDEIWVFNRPLSASEVLYLSNQ